MRRPSDPKYRLLWLGLVMGSMLIVLGVLTSFALLTSAETVVPLATEPLPTVTSISSASSVPVSSNPTDIPSPSPTQTVPTPIPTPTVTTYTIEAGDTLYGIALRYDTTAEAIMAANPSLVSPNDIQSGQVLVIPDHSVSTTATPLPPDSHDGIVHHTVISGETLSDIAFRYDVSVEAIKLANDLTSDLIQAGSELAIPLTEVDIQHPPTGTLAVAWQPSIIQGDINAFYSQVTDTERFILHYKPGSLPAQNLDTILGMITSSLIHIENTLDVHLSGEFDAYAAGSLFASPNLALRGRSFSSERRFLFLYDGTGSLADQQYIIAHELTHVTTWNTMGRPSSVMLHEGVAVYTGMELVEDRGYIPIELFCSAYYDLGQLPKLSAYPSFEGHIKDLPNYYAAGCFVQFLIEEYGTESFGTVYHTGDYQDVYGRSITDLEAEWIASIQTADYSIPFSASELAYYVNQVATSYDLLFSSFRGTEIQMAAYEELDRARMALLQGRLDDTANHLLSFNDLLGQ